MKKYINLASQTLKSFSFMNQKLINSFCSAQPTNNGQNQEFQPKLRKQQQQKIERKSQQYKATNTQNEFVAPEKPIQEYSQELMENVSQKRLADLTNRKELHFYRIQARKEKYDYFNFVLARCYIHHMRYFSEFFAQQDFSRLLHQYDIQQFESFFYNFTLASVFMVDFTEQKNFHYYSQLFINYQNKAEQLVKENAASDQLTLLRLSFILRCIPSTTTTNTQYQEYINKFIPSYFDEVLESIAFNSKTSFSLIDLSSTNQEEGLQFYKNVLSKFTLSENETISKEQSRNFIKSFIILLNKSEESVFQNTNIIFPIIEKSLNCLGENMELQNEIIPILYFISKTGITKENKDFMFKILKIIGSNILTDQKVHLIQMKSLLYSIGKISYSSDNILNFLKKELNVESLKRKLSQEFYDQYIANLILSCTQLEVLTKDNIPQELYQMIFSDKIKKRKFQNDYLISIAISFYRIHYFNLDFWKLLFEKIDLTQSSYYLYLINKSYPTLKDEMSQEVYDLFESKMSSYTMSEVRKVIKINEFELKLQKYLESENIPFQQSLEIDGQYISFQLNEKDVVLIMQLNNYITTENQNEYKYNISTKFKIDYLKKKGYNIIALNSFEGDVTEQFAQIYKKSN